MPTIYVDTVWRCGFVEKTARTEPRDRIVITGCECPDFYSTEVTPLRIDVEPGRVIVETFDRLKQAAHFGTILHAGNGFAFDREGEIPETDRDRASPKWKLSPCPNTQMAQSDFPDRLTSANQFIDIPVLRTPGRIPYSPMDVELAAEACPVNRGPEAGNPMATPLSGQKLFTN